MRFFTPAAEDQAPRLDARLSVDLDRVDQVADPLRRNQYLELRFIGQCLAGRQGDVGDSVVMEGAQHVLLEGPVQPDLVRDVVVE